MMRIDRNFKCVIVCAACMLLLSACSSIPFLGGSDEPERNIASSSTDNSYNNRAELESEIADFKSMKSSLTRLVSLESDLSFLLDEMSRFNEKNPILYDVASNDSPSDEAGKSELIYTASGKTERTVENTADGWAKTQGSMADKWSSQAEEMDQLRIGQSRSPSARPQITVPAKNNGMDQSKFSSNSQVDVAPARPVLQVAQAPNRASNAAVRQVNEDKFSYSSNPQQIVGELDNCSDWKVDSVQNYSLHLASYKTRKSAEDGWNKLDDKYADVWCKTEAKLAKVIVKGSEYLSLRVGGYDSKDKVLQLCSMVKSRGDYCAVSTAEGEILQ